MPQPSIIRLKVVLRRIGISKSALYAMVKAGVFPRPVSIGPRSVGWLESDVDTFICERVRLSRHQEGVQ